MSRAFIRLAIFTSGAYPFQTHGAEVGIFYLAKQLARQGDKVTLYLSEFIRSTQVEGMELPPGMNIVYSGGAQHRFIYNLSFVARSLARLSLKQNRPTILAVNIPTILSLTTAYLANLILRLPYVVIIHGPPDLDVGSGTIRKVQCFLIRRATRIICVSRDLVQTLEQECLIGMQSVKIIPNGYDEAEIEHAKSSASRQVKGAELAFVGYLDENKDPLLLLRSFKLVSLSMPRVMLNIVGSGPLEGQVNEFIEEEQLQNRVILHRSMSHQKLLRLLARCSLLIMTSHREGMPTVAIEALALGTPVVATSVGGLKEIIQEGTNGYLVPERSAEHLAQAVLKVLGDPELRTTLSSGAEKSALNYEWGQIAASYQGLICSITSGDTP